MYYTMLHLPTGLEVVLRYIRNASSKPYYEYTVMTFNNIREVRDCINRRKFFMPSENIVCTGFIGRHRLAYEPVFHKLYVSKHLLEPKRYEEDNVKHSEILTSPYTI